MSGMAAGMKLADQMEKKKRDQKMKIEARNKAANAISTFLTGAGISGLSISVLQATVKACGSSANSITFKRKIPTAYGSASSSAAASSDVVSEVKKMSDVDVASLIALVQSYTQKCKAANGSN